MASRKPVTLLLALLLAGAGLAYVANVWRLRTYPFTDLPDHLTDAYLTRVLADPHEPLRRYYRLEITPLTPGILHAVFASRFADVETGARVHYTLYILLLLGGALALIRLGRGDPWMAALAALLLYNYSLSWGFVGFAMGIALALWAAALLVAFLARPTTSRALAVAGACVALFYAHPVMCVFGCLVVVLAVAARPGLGARWRWTGMAAAAPAALLLVHWLARLERFAGGWSASYYRLHYLPSLPGRVVRLLGNDNFRLGPGILGGVEGSLFTLPLAAGLVVLGVSAARRSRRPGPPWAAAWSALRDWTAQPGPGGAAAAARHVAVAFLAVAAGLYALLPHEPVLCWRFSALILLALVWIAALVVPERARPGVHVAVALLVAAHAAVWTLHFSEFQKRAEPFWELMHHQPLARDRTLAAIIESEPGAVFGQAFIHYQNYQLIWNHGPVATKAAEFEFRLIEPARPGLLPVYQERLSRWTDLRDRLEAYRGMDLLLVRGAHAAASVAASGGYDTLATRGDWVLFGRKKVPPAAAGPGVAHPGREPG